MEIKPDFSANDPFAILGLKPDADKADIRRAYVGLIKQYKPESYPDEFMKIRSAYEILSDPMSFWGETVFGTGKNAARSKSNKSDEEVKAEDSNQADGSGDHRLEYPSRRKKKSGRDENSKSTDEANAEDSNQADGSGEHRLEYPSRKKKKSGRDENNNPTDEANAEDSSRIEWNEENIKNYFSLRNEKRDEALESLEKAVASKVQCAEWIYLYVPIEDLYELCQRKGFSWKNLSNQNEQYYASALLGIRWKSMVLKGRFEEVLNELKIDDPETPASVYSTVAEVCGMLVWDYPAETEKIYDDILPKRIREIGENADRAYSGKLFLAEEFREWKKKFHYPVLEDFIKYGSALDSAFAFGYFIKFLREAAVDSKGVAECFKYFEREGLIEPYCEAYKNIRMYAECYWKEKSDYILKPLELFEAKLDRSYFYNIVAGFSTVCLTADIYIFFNSIKWGLIALAALLILFVVSTWMYSSKIYVKRIRPFIVEYMIRQRIPFSQLFGHIKSNKKKYDDIMTCEHELRDDNLYRYLDGSSID